MKSRLLIRALCVGSALLVPAGGLTVLTAGTAGATQTTVSPSTLKFGILFTMTMGGVTCTTTTAGTQTCNLATAHSGAGQYSITKGGVKFTALLVATLVIKVHAALTITSAKISSGWNFTIKQTTFTGCKITVDKRITFAGSGKVLSTTTITIPTAVIVGAKAGTCTTSDIATIKGQITGVKLKGTITF